METVPEECVEKTECRVCTFDTLELILDLGAQPLANAYRPSADAPPDKTYPLKLMLCTRCFHMQLSHVVDPKIMYSNYQYVSGTSATARRYFQTFAAMADADCESTEPGGAQPRRVLDIACNDGSQLDAFAQLKWVTTGVDPASNVTQTADLKTHRILNGFFTDQFAQTQLTGETFDAIVAQNVVGHIDDVRDFVLGCKRLLAPRGRIYLQTSQSRMIQNNEFDTIYHEHLSYFCVHSMKTLVESCGLYLKSVEHPAIHGNSFLFTVVAEKTDKYTIHWIQRNLDIERREGLHHVEAYHAYASNVEKVCSDLVYCIRAYKALGRAVIGYGAAAKGNTLLNYTRLPLDCIIDDSYIKIGKYTPGTNIPIVALTSIPTTSTSADTVILPLAWNFAEEIKQRVLTRLSSALFVQYFPKIDLQTHGARPRRTCVIMHFYNEEYLLPYWLNHHKGMFDHGILIDYHSTDASAEIVRRMVPDWTLMTSRNEVFGITACDNEVMDIEQTLAAGYWKIALNVTEFLVTRNAPACTLLDYIDVNVPYMYEAVAIPTVVMVESQAAESNVPLDPSRALIRQRTYGDPTDGSRKVRTLHCRPNGNYDFGRHNVRITPHMAAPVSDILVLWYGFSPFNEAVIARKLQIQARMNPKDLETGLGVEHITTREQLTEKWDAMQPKIRNLAELPETAAFFT